MKKMFSSQKNSSVEAMDAPTSRAKVSLTSGTMDSLTSGAVVSPTSGAMVIPTSGAMVSPTSPAMVAPAIQGSSGTEARRPNFQDKDMNAIHKAAKEGNLWRMKQILFFRINDVNAIDKMSSALYVPKESSDFHRTALHVACAYGHPRMVRLLVKRHGIMDFCDDEQKTPLIYVCTRQLCQHEMGPYNTRTYECAHELINRGANLFVSDNDGNTAMHYAVLGHNKATVEKLLNFGQI
ncbi:hypothetical protein QTO34_007992 [Cnephaeus nilssonii]|uniref:ANK_REP_REGION domain-containing protein n=1 Tax=Cnephaeus nilssonii TaxID=3371016 RepID=A0AA40I9F1_CNENI|nr:hypothetical protein QTO34_007992 [Eptesicus nilssonii]